MKKSAVWKRAGILSLLAIACLLISSSGPEVQAGPGLGLSCTPYFGSNYTVGLSASWNSVPGAVIYYVVHFRRDTRGSATVFTSTTGTASGSGLHQNAGAPNNCYLKTADVLAVDDDGAIIADGHCSICEIGFP